MQLRKVEIDNKPDLEFVERLYIESFPRNERRPMGAFHSLIENENIFTVFVVLNDEDERIGFLTYWEFDDYIYAEHYAIAPEFRNGGNGRIAMETFIQQFDKPIVLEVELPETEISKRRIGFYERIGFKLWNIEYQQPPYEEDGSPVPMFLMTQGNIDLNKDFDSIKEELYSKVYNFV